MWSGGLIHRHADGRPIVAANLWLLSFEGDDQNWVVTEVHSDVGPGSQDSCNQIADVLDILAHQLIEPLTAIGNYLNGARAILQTGWPNLGRLREATASASNQMERGADGVRLLRELAVAIRDASE
jgi:hypothetical protein